jgi:hypothetical protein
MRMNYELDKYMADPPMRFSRQCDILAWWKNQIHLLVCDIIFTFVAHTDI